MGMRMFTDFAVDAIVNTGPREDSTRIGSQGTVRRQAVDVSPLRRVNQAISLITVGVSRFFAARHLPILMS
jgi:ribosomal protein S7